MGAWSNFGHVAVSPISASPLLHVRFTGDATESRLPRGHPLTHAGTILW